MEGEFEHTLYQCREVSAFQIPSRPAAGGHRSGDWKVADKVFTGRLKVVAKGQNCEVRLEESTGALFAMCPVAPGQRPTAVEPAADSSRNFVLRLVDSSTGRHAFVGLSFADRSEAFDFNVALSDHEKQLRRTADIQSRADDPATSSSTSASSAQPAQDLRLKQGETIRVNVGKRDAQPSGFMSRLRTSGDGSVTGLQPPPQAGSVIQPQRSSQAQAQGGQDFLGLGQPQSGGLQQPQKQQPPASQSTDSWTTF